MSESEQKYKVPVKKDDLASEIDLQAEFNPKAFGPGSNVERITAHMIKEIEEIRQKPDDLEEYHDMCVLAIDAATRNTGCSGQEFIEGLIAKLRKVRSRTYPDWRDVDPDQPIEHVRGKND